eukprot:7499231-Pyramimonas_sp.AAC.1
MEESASAPLGTKWSAVVPDSWPLPMHCSRRADTPLPGLPGRLDAVLVVSKASDIRGQQAHP